jgi:predicted nucleotidyltransferase
MQKPLSERNMIQPEKVKQLQAWLEHNNDIDVAILFGSYATGSENIQSDIDLAIQLATGGKINAKQKLDYLEQLGNLLLVNIDLIDLKTVGQPLLSQIMKYGKLLKGDTNAYAEIAIRNINTAQDFLPYIKRMMAERRLRYL